MDIVVQGQNLPTHGFDLSPNQFSRVRTPDGNILSIDIYRQRSLHEQPHLLCRIKWAITNVLWTLVSTLDIANTVQLEITCSAESADFAISFNGERQGPEKVTVDYGY